MSTGHRLSVCLGFRIDFVVAVNQCIPTFPVPYNSLLLCFKVQLYSVHVLCTMTLKTHAL